MKNLVIRPGDKVRVLRDRFIERVGYPLVWWMLEEEVENDPRVHEALRVLEIPGFTAADNANFPSAIADAAKVPRAFLIAVAKMRVEERGFGGRERQIFYEKQGGFGRWPGCVLEVYSKRIAKTGSYYPPGRGYSTMSYDADPEPGGLENCKTHIILMTASGEIEACDVEKL